MTKHIVDRTRPTDAGRVVHFLAIARAAKATWHRSEAPVGPARVVQFCRIARGRLV